MREINFQEKFIGSLFVLKQPFLVVIKFQAWTLTVIVLVKGVLRRLYQTGKLSGYLQWVNWFNWKCLQVLSNIRIKFVVFDEQWCRKAVICNTTRRLVSFIKGLAKVKKFYVLNRKFHVEVDSVFQSRLWPCYLVDSRIFQMSSIDNTAFLLLTSVRLPILTFWKKHIGRH